MPPPRRSVASRNRETTLPSDRERVLERFCDSREIAERLDRFVALLLQWQTTTNLIAPSTIRELWTRHVADSLQLVRLAPDSKRWVDLGSGGGFPGIVIACALANIPGAAVHLVESNQKKAAFLREAVRMTGAPAKVHARRIEEFVDGFDDSVEIVTARALTSLANLLEKSYPLLKSGAQGLFLKGQDIDAELTEAAKYWTMDIELMPSLTDPSGRVVRVKSAERLQPLRTGV